MSYRHLPVTKFMSGGKKRRYKNLATFNKECSKRALSGNQCFLINKRCLKDGGGLATVRSVGAQDTIKRRYMGRPSGTWRLHFASCTVMKQHLRDRVDVGEKSLDGARRKKKRKRSR